MQMFTQLLVGLFAVIRSVLLVPGIKTAPGHPSPPVTISQSPLTSSSPEPTRSFWPTPSPRSTSGQSLPYGDDTVVLTLYKNTSVYCHKDRQSDITAIDQTVRSHSAAYNACYKNAYNREEAQSKTCISSCTTDACKSQCLANRFANVKNAETDCMAAQWPDQKHETDLWQSAKSNGCIDKYWFDHYDFSKPK